MLRKKVYSNGTGPSPVSSPQNTGGFSTIQHLQGTRVSAPRWREAWEECWWSVGVAAPFFLMGDLTMQGFGHSCLCVLESTFLEARGGLRLSVYAQVIITWIGKYLSYHVKDVTSQKLTTHRLNTWTSCWCSEVPYCLNLACHLLSY